MQKIHLPYKPAHMIITVAAVLATTLLGLSHFGLLPFGHLPVGSFTHAPVSVTTASVSTIAKAVEIPMTGAVESRKAAIISAQISGRIIEVNVSEGQMVTAGEQLLRIKGMAPAGNTVTNGTANAPFMQNEEANQQAQANYENILKEYERYQKLYQLGAIPRRQLEDLEARLETAKEALSAPVQDNNAPSLTAGGNSTPQEVIANITAPIAGKITEISAANEASVQTGQQLMVVDNGGEVRVVVRLEQQDLYLVHSGTQAKITVDGAPDQVLTGQVEAIYPEIGTDTRSFRTHIRVDNTSGLLKTGIQVNVMLCMDQSVPVCAVPKTAIWKEQGLSYVYMAVDGKAVRQQVNIGTTLGEFIEITSDLPEQAVVVTSNLNNLKDGDALAIQ